MTTKQSMLNALKELASIDAYYAKLYQTIKNTNAAEFKALLERLQQSKQVNRSRYDTGFHSRDSLIYQDSVDYLKRALTRAIEVR